MRYNRIFEKVGEIHEAKSNKLNVVDLNEGLEILGLHMNPNDWSKAISEEGKNGQVVSASKKDAEDFNESTPFDYKSAFNFAVINLSKNLKRYKET